jgi:Cof subfamily protein (haloacid dehalogenase superfamily)
MKGFVNLKLIAVDLDGTLLNDQHEIDLENVEMLQAVSRKGVKVVVTTGRSLVGGQQIFSKLGLSGDLIALNGAVTVAVSKKYEMTVTNTHYLSNEEVALALRALKNRNGTIFFNNLEHNYCILSQHSEKMNVQEFLNRRKELQVVSFEELTSLMANGLRLNKMAFSSQEVAELQSVRHALIEQEVNAFFSDTYYVEIIADKTSKGAALRDLCRNLAIPLEQVVAFGDQENDSEMLQVAGIGVAMGNATRHIKQIADMITETNNHAGVAKAIKQLMN